MNKDLDIVYGDIDYVDNQGNIKRRWRSEERRDFAIGWHPAHPGFYAKRNLFIEYGGFDERLKIAADFDLMLRFLEVANTKASYLEKVCVNMKLGGESNRSIKNIIKGNKEIISSFAKYKIIPQRFYTLRRWIGKLRQKEIYES